MRKLALALFGLVAMAGRSLADLARRKDGVTTIDKLKGRLAAKRRTRRSQGVSGKASRSA